MHWLYDVPDWALGILVVGATVALTVSTAVMLGLVIFVIVVLDHPLWGTQGLGAEPIADVSRILGGAGR